ncbi:hypothetical protein BDW02DRAFT_491755 [Decorospora gaudefroyi]|uniref:Fungal calcium binding protein domain-containing protein n=1 Tax=Decorospora gaudefroyi TaxID=184978 RepID=A0A6A5KME3_9PLEO|nr:hypothetical protein BDW02DRAFT_491755 [Decorospora gaudefroyi]
MRFSTITITALAGLAAASPAASSAQDTQMVKSAIQFASQSQACPVFDCATVVASAACIGASIALGPAGVASALACVATGASGLCGCSDCVPGLQEFLEENDVC